VEVIYSEKAQKDREFWKKSGNKAIMNKITTLIEDIQLHPFEGIGKPEPLKYELSGRWSRRINQEHRIIYKVTEEEDTIEILDILSLKGHYE
jgi:toxin YoeB